MKTCKQLVQITFLIVSSFLVPSCAVLDPPTTVCFSPHGGCTTEIVTEIEQAKSEILIQAHSLTSKRIADAVIKANAAGVKVEIILDRSYGYTHNSASYFAELKNIPTYIDADHAISRNNIIIIDGGKVITGSFSFTKEAEEKNAGNLVIIDSLRLARTYVENWNLHRSHSEEFKKKAPSPREVPKNKKKRKRRTRKKAS